MALWNRCAVCGRDIPVGELCYGIKRNGESICFDCIEPENGPTLTPPNEPLTIEQLREMNRFSHPIWDECLHEWCAVRPDVCAGEQGISYLGGGSRPLESGRFYRRPPEGEEDT